MVRRCEIVGGVSRFLVATHPTLLAVAVRRCGLVNVFYQLISQYGSFKPDPP